MSVYDISYLYIGGRPDPRSSVRCSYPPPLVTALGLWVAGSVCRPATQVLQVFKVCKFCKFRKCRFASSAVLALECEDSSVVSKVFERYMYTVNARGARMGKNACAARGAGGDPHRALGRSCLQRDLNV